jgi:hypothetical protein
MLSVSPLRSDLMQKFQKKQAQISGGGASRHKIMGSTNK